MIGQRLFGRINHLYHMSGDAVARETFEPLADHLRRRQKIAE
jgi:hypothetical protein